MPDATLTILLLCVSFNPSRPFAARVLLVPFPLSDSAQVAPSRIQSPISPFTPIGLPGWGVEMTIKDFATCAQLAQDAGYDGVEVMCHFPPFCCI